MKFSTAAATSALTLANMAMAQTIVSAPFKLAIESKGQYDGSYLATCHEGAAVEGLCVVPANSSYIGVFNFNSSSYEVSSEYGVTGVVTFNLPVGSMNVSEPMNLAFDATSNVAVPIFEPEYPNTYVGFDSKNRMNIQSLRNDKVSPPSYNTTEAYYRWYVCLTAEGYLYETLAWVVGPGKPENPSCEKVTVVREFL